MTVRLPSPRRVLAIALLVALPSLPGAVASAWVPAAHPTVAATDVRYGAHPRQRLDVLLPSSARGAARPAVLLFHGGGWFAGDKVRMTPIAQALASAGFVVFNVDYTLATRTQPGFPLQLAELRTALAWVEGNAARFGADPRRLGALGTSAGGNLAALLATTSGGRFAALATWSAPFDLTTLAPGPLRGLAAVFTGCRRLACPARAAAASPLAHVGPTTPPTLIVNSRRELVPARQALRMAQALDGADVARELLLVAGTLHGRELTPYALAPTIAFLRRRL